MISVKAQDAGVSSSFDAPQPWPDVSETQRHAGKHARFSAMGPYSKIRMCVGVFLSFKILWAFRPSSKKSFLSLLCRGLEKVKISKFKAVEVIGISGKDCFGVQ